VGAVFITLSVGRVAGFESPAFFDLFDVSISSGTKRLRSMGACASRGWSCGVETGVRSGVGNGLLTTGSLLLLKVVSTGSGTNCLLGLAMSFFSCPCPGFCAPSSSSFLLLLAVVSTGSTANRRTFLAVVSTGVGEKRLEAGGGEVSIIVSYRTGRRTRVTLSSRKAG
jgi:hypothetical protein